MPRWIWDYSRLWRLWLERRASASVLTPARKLPGAHCDIEPALQDLVKPPGQMTEGTAAIRALYEHLLATKPVFKLEEPLPTLRNGDLALTATRSADNSGVRAQVARRQPDRSWLRILDRPETHGERNAAAGCTGQRGSRSSFATLPIVAPR